MIDLSLGGLEGSCMTTGKHIRILCNKEYNNNTRHTNGALLGESLVAEELGIDALERWVAVVLGSLDAVAMGLFVLVVVGVVLRLGHFSFLEFLLVLKSKRWDSPSEKKTWNALNLGLSR